MKREGRSAPRARAYPPGALAFLASLLLVATFGCAHSRQGDEVAVSSGAGGEKTQVEAEILAEVRESLETRRVGISSLRGRGFLWISSPEWQGAGQVNTIILARRPDELRMRGLLPFSTVFDVVSSADRFHLHFPGEGEVWSGPPEELAPLTGLPILPRDVIAGMFAAPLIEAKDLVLSDYDHTRIWVEWTLNDGSRVRGEFTRDPVLPREFAIMEADQLRLRLQYDDYLLEPDGWWPRDVTLRWPELETRMRIRFVEIELNPVFKPGSFVFEAPEGVQWLEVDSGERISTDPQEGEEQ